MSNQYFGETDTANVRQATIAALVQEQLREASRLAPTVTDYSALATKGSQSVAIPRGSDLTVGAKSEDTLLNGQHFTYGADTIALAQRAALVNVDDIARIQSSFDIELDLISRMGVALADDLDTVIYTELRKANASPLSHIVKYTDTGNNDVEIKDITTASKLLTIQKVPFMDRYMLIGPTQMDYVMNISSFVEAHRLGSPEAIRNGVIGRLYGFNVVLSNVPETNNEILFYHKSAAAFAIQDGVKFEEDRDLRALSNVKAASYIVGAKILDNGYRVVRVEPT